MSTKRKAFMCDIGEAPCGKEFTTIRALTRHVRESAAHCDNVGSNPFGCGLCPQTFTREHGLKRHVDEVHLGGTRKARLRDLASAPASAQHHCRLPSQGLQQADADISPDDATDGGNSSSISATSSDLEDASAGAASTTATSVSDGSPRSSLTPESDLGVADMCDRLRFLDLSQQSSEDPRLSLDSETRERLTELRMSGPKTKTKGIECSLCYQIFEDLKAGHTCDICQIAFTHAKDLQRHLDCATQGNCGFAFKHVEPCSGHHPPPYEVNSHRPSSYEIMRNPYKKRIKVDDDRFNFCLRIQHWEQAQLSKYISHVMELEAIGNATHISPPVALWESKLRYNLQMDLAFWRQGYAKRMTRSEPGDSRHDHLQLQWSHSLTYCSTRALSMDSRSRISALKSRTDLHSPQSLQSKTSTHVDDKQQSQFHTSSFPDVFPRCDGAETGSSGTMYSLEEAACAGDIDMTRTILLSGTYSWENDVIGFNALHYAALFGFDKVLELLLDGGAPVDSKDAQGRTSLNLAIAQYHYRVAELLLCSGADPDAIDSSGERMLFKCSAYVDDSYISLLIRHGAAVDAVRRKVAYGAERYETTCYPEQFQASERGINTAIQNAIWHGRSTSVSHLLDAGASLFQVGVENKTLLDLALKGGHCHLADQLLDRGAPVSHSTVELAIAAECSVALVSRILNADGVADSTSARRGLQQACSRQRLEVVELLLSMGFRPESDALCSAVAIGDYDLVKLFLECGASLEGKGDDYTTCPTTPLAVAVSMQDAAMVRFLLDQGADIDQLSGKMVGEARVTPLVLAIDLGDVVMVKGLISRGADTEIQSYIRAKDISRLRYEHLPFDGTTLRNVRAIDVATWCGQSTIVDVLVEAGTKPCDLYNKSLISESITKWWESYIGFSFERWPGI